MNQKQHTDPAQLANKQDDLSSIHYASSLVSGHEHEIDTSDETYEDALFSSDAELEQHLAAPTLEDAAQSAQVQQSPGINNEALYSSEADLDQALAEAELKKQQADSIATEQNPADSKQAADPVSDDAPETPSRIDLSAFLPKANRELPGKTSYLSIASGGFNRYPSAAKMSLGGEPTAQVDINTYLSREIVEPIEAEPVNDIAENKFSDKAKLFYSDQKAKLDEYFGRSLPERTLDLEFHFTTQKAKKDFEYIVRGIDIEKAFKTKGRPPESLFKQADENLLNLSKCKMSRGNRLRLLNTYCEYLAPLYETIMQQQSRKPNASSDEKRSAIAEHGCNALKHLITGYKQIYSEFYLSPNVVYGPQRGAANEIAYKIIDLIVFEQSVHAFLEKPPQRTSIPAINNLFIALRSYEPQELKRLRKSISMNRHASINELFCRYQLLLTFDLLSISPTQQPALSSYLQEYKKCLQIVDPFDSEALDEPVLIIQYQQSEPAVYDTKLSTQTVVPVFIRVQEFFQQIQKHLDCYKKGLGKIETTKQCKTFAELSSIESLSLLNSLQHFITLIEKQVKPKVYEVYRPQKLQACAGLVQSVKFLEYQYALNRSRTLEKNEEDTELPEKSELDKGKWACAAEEGGFIYMQAQTKLLIDVGDIVLLAKNSTEMESISIARTIRVERTDSCKTNFIFESLANEVSSAKVTRANNKLTPALLAQHNDQLILILSADESIHTGQILKTKLADGKNVAYAVKQIIAGSKKTQILAIV